MKRFQSGRMVAAGAIALVMIGMLTRSDAQAPAGQPLISEGLDAQGELRLEIGKQAILKTSRQFKRLSVARPDVMEAAPVNPTQFMVTGISPGRTDVTVWDDNDQTQTIHAIVRGEGGAREGVELWAATGNLIERSTVPGFVILSLRTGPVHLAVSHIVAVVVEESSPGQRARIVISVDAQEIHPEHARSFIVPPERMSAGDVLNVVAEARR